MTIDELTELLRLYLSSCQTDDEKIQALNHIRCCLHRFSPLRDEPVDCVMWVRTDEILANDYNPNVMAPLRNDCWRCLWRKMVLPSQWW